MESTMKSISNFLTLLCMVLLLLISWKLSAAPAEQASIDLYESESSVLTEIKESGWVQTTKVTVKPGAASYYITNRRAGAGILAREHDFNPELDSTPAEWILLQW